MSDFEVSKGTLAEIVQSLQEAKKMARSLENVASSLVPLAATDEVASMLDNINIHAAHCVDIINKLYARNAREALK